MQWPLNIGVVAPRVAPLAEAQPYGNHVFLADLACGLRDRGHDVVVYAAEGSVLPGVPVDPVRVDMAAQRRFLVLRDHERDEAEAMRRSFDRLFDRLRARRHDVVSQHAFDAPALDANVDMPALHTLHLPPMREEVVAAARRRRQRLASVSESCARQWKAATARDIIALPNGVPDVAVDRRSPDAVALMAGRISREKGFAAGLRVARRAGLAAVIVGEIYDETYFPADVMPELRGATLRSAMPRIALRQWMQRAAVVLMPIEWDEPFGLVAAEAQLAGCPVVGYARGALPDIVANGIGGFLVAPGDEDALVDAIGAARRLDRTTIREQALPRFSMSACIERYENVLRSLAEHHR